MTVSSTFSTKGGGTGQKQSLLDSMELLVVNKTHFINNAPKGMKPQNPTHLFNTSTLTNPGNVQTIEGAAISLGAVSELGQETNWVQESNVGYSISDLMAETFYGGVADRVVFETQKALEYIGCAIEAGMIVNTGYSGVSNAARQAKGLAYWCTASTANTATGTSGTAFATTASGQSKVDAVLEQMAENGEPADMLVASGLNARMIGQWTAYATRQFNSNETEQNVNIEIYRTPFGRVKVLVSTYAEDTFVPIIAESEYHLCYMIKPRVVKAGKVSYATDFAIQSAWTTEFRRPLGAGNVTLS